MGKDKLPDGQEVRHTMRKEEIQVLDTLLPKAK